MAKNRAMLSASFIQDTDRWLCRTPGGPLRPLVSLNSRPGALPDGTARELSGYLNGVDDESGSGWRAFETAELLELVTHPLQATGGRALAPADGCTGCSCPGDDCGTRKKYKAAVTLLRQMARRGGAVVSLPGACRATRDFGHAFHVWFECSPEHRTHRTARWNRWDAAQAGEFISRSAAREEDWTKSVFGPHSGGCGLFCHLTINIDQFGNLPVIPIVGDTALEWAALRNRGAPRQAHDVHGESQSTQSAATSRVLQFPQSLSSRLL